MIAESPLLDTTSAAGDRVLDNREIAQLPYTTMNPFSLQAITPGVIFTGSPGIARVFDNAGTASYGSYGLVAGGGIVAGNEFLLDGAPVTGTNGGRAGFVPSSQAVGEMRVETSPFDASLGHTGGIFVSATTKAGTNSITGRASIRSRITAGTPRRFSRVRTTRTAWPTARSSRARPNNRPAN